MKNVLVGPFDQNTSFQTTTMYLFMQPKSSKEFVDAHGQRNTHDKQLNEHVV
jgi:hypothetical protein